MNSFSELLDTEISLTVRIAIWPPQAPGHATVRVNDSQVFAGTVDQPIVINHSVDLLGDLNIEVCGSVDLQSVTVDGFEMWPTFGWQQGDCKNIHVGQPFYRWHHQVTGQGWLLQP